MNYHYSYPPSVFNLDMEKKERQVMSLPLLSFTKKQLCRQYTFTCEQDFIDINEGYCPKYAVYWLDEHNKAHWPKGTVIRHREEYLSKKESEEKETVVVENSLKELYIYATTNRSVHFDLFREIIPIFTHE